MVKLYATNVESKITQLEALARINALNLLEGPWPITCEKCGQSFEVELTTERLRKTCLDQSILIWSAKNVDIRIGGHLKT